MRQFVTGGAGFIGSAYVRTVLTETDDEVTVYDALTYAGHTSSLAEVWDHPRFRFVHADICDVDSVESTMPGHDVVVHFAAETHVDRSISDPHAFARTNVVGTNVLCDAARRHGIHRFVHVSTDEVYGTIAEGSFKETDILTPRSPYSAAKAGSDLLALSYHTTFGLPVVVTRCSNNFGPYQHPEKVIPLFTTNLLDGKQVPLYGDGGNIRDWLFVEDHVSALRTIAEQGAAGEVYNIAAHTEITNYELTMRLLELCGRDESAVDHVPDRLGHDRRYSITTDKLEGLGWKPAGSFERCLEDTVQWYRSRRDWWEPIKAAG